MENLGIDQTIRPVLGVEQARRFRKLNWNWIAVLDFLAIGAFTGFLHAELIFAPGESIELSVSSSAESRRVEAVLSIVGDLYLFNGSVYSATEISDGFQTYFERKGHLKNQATLLIKIDAQSPIQSLMQLCDEAQQAGFLAVHLAQVPERAADALGFDF